MLVDAIQVDQSSGTCHLTIADQLAWQDDHLPNLQAKINIYLRFIESGEIYVAYPVSRGCDFVIDARFNYRPTAEALAFLEQAQRILEDAGFTLRFGPLAASYADDN